jgi:hypothetical protein
VTAETSIIAGRRIDQHGADRHQVAGSVVRHSIAATWRAPPATAGSLYHRGACRHQAAGQAELLHLAVWCAAPARQADQSAWRRLPGVGIEYLPLSSSSNFRHQLDREAEMQRPARLARDTGDRRASISVVPIAACTNAEAELQDDLGYLARTASADPPPGRQPRCKVGIEYPP